MRTNTKNQMPGWEGPFQQSRPGTTLLVPGINSNNPQVRTLGPQRTLVPTPQFCHLGPLVPIGRLHPKGHHFERRIKFLLNTRFIEQESEEIAHASLFPEGCPAFVVKHSEETADEGTMPSC